MRNHTQHAKTWDKGPPADGPEIFTVEQIGPNREKTPNGNLVCRNVPIARVGWMIYADGETPIKADPKVGYARVYRGEDELFDPKTIGSFMGVAVTDEHPEDDVDPTNWADLSRGFSTTNVRRGDGEYADCLLADLIVTHEDLIKAINDNKREVSCGYSADYRQTGEGTGIQTNIIGNHIALVEKGRCGPRCAIGDQETIPQQPAKEETKMSKGTRVRLAGVNQRETLRQRMRVMVRDMGGLLEETADPGMDDLDGDPDDDNGTHIHIHTGGTSGQGDPATGKTVPGQDDLGGDPNAGGGDPMEARVAALEQGMQAIQGTLQQLAEAVGKMTGGTPDADPDLDPDDPDADPATTPAKDDGGQVDPEGADLMTSKTGDSTALATSFQQLLADAEILVPGLRVPTFDAKAKRKTTVDTMCSLRRKALTAAMNTRDGAALIEAAAGPKCDVDAMTCQQAASVFRAAVTARKIINNASATRDAGKLPNVTTGVQPAKVRTIDDINKANAEFWAKQGA